MGKALLRLVREIKPNYKLCHHDGRGMYYSVDPASSLAFKSHKLAFVGRHKCTQTMFGLANVNWYNRSKCTDFGIGPGVKWRRPDFFRVFFGTLPLVSLVNLGSAPCDWEVGNTSRVVIHLIEADLRISCISYFLFCRKFWDSSWNQNNQPFMTLIQMWENVVFSQQALYSCKCHSRYLSPLLDDD